jgi:DNA-binding beta-propeller fold protein YncE
MGHSTISGICRGLNGGSDVGIHVSIYGTVYVPQVAANRIGVYDTDGNTLAQWGSEGTGPGYFRSPYDICDNPLGITYVADLGNQWVQKFRFDKVVAVSAVTWGQIKVRGAHR